MDFSILILLMLVLYVVPELFRRRKPRTYEYPEIPDETIPPVPVAKTPKPEILPLYSENSLAQAALSEEKQAVTTIAPLPMTERTVLQQAVIYSEILQKPRAYRPIYQKRR